MLLYQNIIVLLCLPNFYNSEAHTAPQNVFKPGAKIDPVRIVGMHACVCVCVCPRPTLFFIVEGKTAISTKLLLFSNVLLITSGVIWYDKYLV